MKDVRTATLPRFLICTPLIVSGLGSGQGSIVADDTGPALAWCQSARKGRRAWGSWAGRAQGPATAGDGRSNAERQGRIRSTPGYAALHRAMNPGLQKG